MLEGLWNYMNITVYGEVTVYDILLALIILMLASLIGKAISINLRRSIKDRVSKDRVTKISKFIYYVSLIIGLMIALPILGLNPSGLLVAGGIFALVLGFASQSVVSNLISGVLLAMEHPVKVGDTVTIEGKSGVVQDIKIMSTVIRTFDGVFLRIPNDKVFTSIIENYLAHPVRRFQYNVGIRYADDAERAKEIVEGIIEDEPLALVNPSPQVFVQELGDNSVKLTIRIWSISTEWYDIYMKVLWRIKRALEAQGIQIPFPQRELWFRNELDLSGKRDILGSGGDGTGSVDPDADLS